MLEVAGCEIVSLNEEEVKQVLDWIVGEAPCPGKLENQEFRWVLAYCHDGVTWGRYDDGDGGRWVLGSSVAPDKSPVPTRKNVLELRVFGPSAEVLLWREGARLRGRLVEDLPEDVSIPDFLQPLTEKLLLRGRTAQSLDSGFSLIEDGTGARQVVPVDVKGGMARKLRLVVRHYCSCLPHNGVVRVALTRLVALVLEGTKDGA